MFEAMHGALLQHSFRYTSSREAAQDVVQDVFLKVWEKRDTIDPSKSLKALLYTITGRLSLNYLRSRKQPIDPLPDTGLSDNEPSVEMRLDAEIVGKGLKRCIEELPPRRREAFVLSRYEELSHKEIAEVMGLTPRTVNTHISLAIRTLRQCLADMRKDRSDDA